MPLTFYMEVWAKRIISATVGCNNPSDESGHEVVVVFFAVVVSFAVIVAVLFAVVVAFLFAFSSPVVCYGNLFLFLYFFYFCHFFWMNAMSTRRWWSHLWCWRLVSETDQHVI